LFLSLRDIFRKYRVEKTLGLSLVHRHFDLSFGERLVEYENVAAPWVLDDVDPQLHQYLQPKSWAFVDDQLYPYEYSFNPAEPRSNTNEPDARFLAEFHAILKAHRLEKTLGLNRANHRIQLMGAMPMVEFTAGRANVLMPITKELEDTYLIEAEWLFPCVWDPVQGGNGSPQTRYCVVVCKGHKLPSALDDR
jgi:hypothetical protein